MALPDDIDFLRFAEQGRELTGCYKLEEMVRLRDAVASGSGVIDVNLTFERDAQGRFRVSGALTAQLELVCQRCLEAMPWPVNIAMDLVLARSEAEADYLAQGEDSLIVDEGLTSLKDVVEDEILLALPPVPRHDEADCPVKLVDYSDDVDTAESRRKNPFDVLKTLKH